MTQKRMKMSEFVNKQHKRMNHACVRYNKTSLKKQQEQTYTLI